MSLSTDRAIARTTTPITSCVVGVEPASTEDLGRLAAIDGCIASGARAIAATHCLAAGLVAKFVASLGVVFYVFGLLALCSALATNAHVAFDLVPFPP